MLGPLLIGEVMRMGNACPWMRPAVGELGQRERPGKRRNNPRIIAYLRVVGFGAWDETPWCSAFANWCMLRAGIPGTGRATARSWLGWGTALDPGRPRFGCVAVLRRTSNPARGHVGFWVGARAGQVLLLGGNQDDAVCVKAYPRSKLLGLRWPIQPPVEGVSWA